MAEPRVSDDPMWPRAADWFIPAEAADGVEPDIGLLGVPAYRTSITPTGAAATPAAVRSALRRYSTYAASRGVDVSQLKAVDFGNAEEPDGPEGEARVGVAVRGIADSGCRLLVALGGDNSLTYSVMRGLAGEQLSEWGLITVDAHHDIRDGESNGSPVRRLIEAALPPERVVQVGIADFSNSPAYAARARDLGISVFTRAEMAAQPVAAVLVEALDIAGEGGRPIFIDIDVDVCDRAVVPGCPSAAPGGLSAYELRQIAYLAAADPRVRGMDITEIDATKDADDERTVRLAALLVLEAAAGLLAR